MTTHQLENPAKNAPKVRITTDRPSRFAKDKAIERTNRSFEERVKGLEDTSRTQGIEIRTQGIEIDKLKRKDRGVVLANRCLVLDSSLRWLGARFIGGRKWAIPEQKTRQCGLHNELPGVWDRIKDDKLHGSTISISDVFSDSKVSIFFEAQDNRGRSMVSHLENDLPVLLSRICELVDVVEESEGLGTGGLGTEGAERIALEFVAYSLGREEWEILLEEIEARSLPKPSFALIRSVSHLL